MSCYVKKIEVPLRVNDKLRKHEMKTDFKV
jgi:hypothetical protein